MRRRAARLAIRGAKTGNASERNSQIHSTPAQGGDTAKAAWIPLTLETFKAYAV